MNKLPVAKRVQILSLLCEGSSMRAISRVCDVSINTVSKLLEDAGDICMSFHDEKVRALRSRRVQVDEVWSFCGAKDKNVKSMKRPVDGAGDVWTWTAIDADSKLIISWYVGGRDAACAKEFIEDLAERVDRRIQLTSDGWVSYLAAVGNAFHGLVDYAMLQKIYGTVTEGAKGRYSPAECIGAKKIRVIGLPDPNRRFTRLTNAFSKKFMGHVHALAIYFVFYNWVRIHKSLRVTPAMAAGLTDKLMGFEDIVALMDAVAPAPKRPAVYRKKPLQISN